MGFLSDLDKKVWQSTWCSLFYLTVKLHTPYAAAGFLDVLFKLGLINLVLAF